MIDSSIFKTFNFFFFDLQSYLSKSFMDDHQSTYLTKINLTKKDIG